MHPDTRPATACCTAGADAGPAAARSAVDFAGPARMHVALAVADLERSAAFYRAAFAVLPTKLRPGYARFEVEAPPLILSLNEFEPAGGPHGPAGPASVLHFGVQLKSAGAVAAAAERLARAGLAVRREAAADCCYAVQEKVWIDDPDGHAWEFYVVLDDAGRRHLPEGRVASGCCAPGGA